MASFITALASSISRGYAFNLFTRFINPELLAALMYFGVLVASVFLPYEYVENFGGYIFIEFIMIHSGAAMSVALFFSKSERMKRVLVILVGAFYSLFILGMAIGLGAWWTVLIFSLLIYERFKEPLADQSGNIVGEILLIFIRFFIYMISAGVGFLLTTGLFDLEDGYGMVLWGGIYYLSLYLLRGKIVILRNELIKK